MADEWVVPSESPQTFDAFIPLMSLPHALGISTETLPNQVPYLRVRANGRESGSRGDRYLEMMCNCLLQQSLPQGEG